MKQKILSLFVSLVATTTLWAQNNVISYTAKDKLTETSNRYIYDRGLRNNAFNVTITSHEFSNGTGIITFAGDVTTIGECAFANCYDLTSIDIPCSVTTIKHDAFFRCTGLISITIPPSVTDLGHGFIRTFCDVNNIVCNNPTLLRRYGSRFGSDSWFGGEKCINGYVDGCLVYSDSSKTKLCGCSSAATGEITIPNTVTTIGRRAFVSCYGLTSITIPNSVTTIGEEAFYGCRGLTSITIANSVIEIGNNAFAYCTALPIIDNIRYADSYLIEVIDKTLSTYTIKDGTKWIGNNAFEGCIGLTSVTIPNSVIKFGHDAFIGCTSLPIRGSIRYADSYLVEVIDTTLSTYTIQDGTKWIGDNAFKNCIGLTSITIPNSVTTIGDYAFNGCCSLTSIEIPNSVTTIGENAFESVNNVVYHGVATWSNDYDTYWGALHLNEYVEGNLTYSDSTKMRLSYCSPLVEGKIIIPNSVTTIGDGAFRDCSGLTSVKMGRSVTTIGDYAFALCEGLTSVKIPNSVTTIGDGAFFSCNGLTSVTIPNSVTTIGDGAFSNCEGLTSVKIPNSVTTIGDGAFFSCNGLTSVTIPNSVTTIGGYAFEGCCSLASINVDASNTHYSSVDGVLFNYAKDTLIQYPIGNTRTEYSIPNSVTTIGNYTFGGCSNLTSVKIPNSVTTIGENAFESVNNVEYLGNTAGAPWGAKCVNGYVDGYLVYSDASKTILCGCSSAAIGEIIIPNSVTTIGENAFSGCGGLTSVTIPNSVTTIGGWAFFFCDGLTSVTIPNSVTTIGYEAFYGCSNLTSVTFVKNSRLIKIGNRVFNECSKLLDITLPNSVTQVGE